MLKQSYLNNYVLSYLWKTLAMSMGILSMLIVIPVLSANKFVYGIYTVCISIGFFLNYADIGFFSAGLKYAGECFSKGEREKEYELFGFISFILLIFVAVIAIAFCVFAYNPSLLINDVKDSSSKSIASNLLIIQAVFSFNYVITRLVDGIYGIRIESYIFQKYQLVGNLIKILSVFIFFSDQKYDIVSYFAFTKTVDLSVNLLGIMAIRQRYGYSLKQIIHAFKFNLEVYQKIKGLAYGTFIATLFWVIFYELDVIVIGKLLGSQSVAIFAIGYVLANYFRSILSIIYGPFQSRFNHLVGFPEKCVLDEFVVKIIRLTMPAITFSLISVILLSKNVVLTWVGADYLQSILIVKLLMLSFILAFISVPTAYLMNSLVNTRFLYFVSLISAVTFWVGVLLTIDMWGVTAFAIFKLVSNTLEALVCLYFLLDYLKMRLNDFLWRTVYDQIIPILVVIAFALLVQQYLPTAKNIVNLLKVTVAIICSVTTGFVALYFSSRSFRNDVHHYFLLIMKSRR